ncbi:hypothetical protein BDW59DRAFT_146239, partial [Aspergillus cavernicola]
MLESTGDTSETTKVLLSCIYPDLCLIASPCRAWLIGRQPCTAVLAGDQLAAKWKILALFLTVTVTTV